MIHPMAIASDTTDQNILHRICLQDTEDAP